MTPLTQTSLYDPATDAGGNCMAACIASILDAPEVMHEAPDLLALWHAGESWVNGLNAYLLRHHGRMYIETPERLTPHLRPRGWHLINGPGPRGVGHSIVGLEGAAVWDPHPSRGGVLAVESFGLLIPTDPDAQLLANLGACRHCEARP